MESKLVFDFKTTQQIIKKVAFIDSFKGKWMGLAVKESIYLKELKQIATIERKSSIERAILMIDKKNCFNLFKKTNQSK